MRPGDKHPTEENWIFVKEVEVRGQQFPVYLDVSTETSVAEYGGKSFWGANTADVRIKLMEQTRRDSIPLDIEFDIEAGGGAMSPLRIERRTLAKIHSGNGNPIYRKMHRGKVVTEQGEWPRRYDVDQATLRPLTPEQQKQLINLRWKDAEIKLEIKNFYKEHGFDLKAEVAKKLGVERL